MTIVVVVVLIVVVVGEGAHVLFLYPRGQGL
jgi:hypothetical protein